MQNLKVNSLILFFFITACASLQQKSLSYRIMKRVRDLSVIEVATDRLSAECSIASEERNSYSLSMYILDDENTVLSSFIILQYEQKDCLKVLSKINKMIIQNQTLYIGGIGNITQPRIKESYNWGVIHFEKYGDFKTTNGRLITLETVFNGKDQCYNTLAGEKEPCPEPRFDIRNI